LISTIATGTRFRVPDWLPRVEPL